MLNDIIEQASETWREQDHSKGGKVMRPQHAWCETVDDHIKSDDDARAFAHSVTPHMHPNFKKLRKKLRSWDGKGTYHDFVCQVMYDYADNFDQLLKQTDLDYLFLEGRRRQLANDTN